MNKILVLPAFVALVLSTSVHANDVAIKNSLSRIGIYSADIHPSPVAGLKTVLTESGVFYFSDDGRHVMRGPLYEVGSNHPVNVTHQFLSKSLNALQKDMIVFKAPQEKHVVTVFTDITCNYCHKLHEQIKEYNALGITIRYLAFPNRSLNSQTEKNIASVWCNANQKDAFNRAINGGNVQSVDCDIDISKHYTLGVQYGIQGTPTLLLDNGTLLPGYQSPKELSIILDQKGSDRTIEG